VKILASVYSYYRSLTVSITRGRVFKASDGKEYCWQLCFGPIEVRIQTNQTKRNAKKTHIAIYIQLIRNDESKKRVAKYQYYRPSMGRLTKGRPPSLEVDDSCIPILDEIIMTFIYCHKLREIRERSHWGDGGATGP
jgi:hypothetical protein